MLCSIYKGLKKSDSYLYVLNKDDFSSVPESLLSILGKLEFVMILNLKPTTKLVQSDINDVLTELDSKGFYLQLSSSEIIFDYNSKLTQSL